MRFLSQFGICFVCVAFLSAAGFADRSRERTEVGHNISIGADEEVTEATCFGCSIRVKGHVSGDITTFGGSIVIEENGRVDGDATTFAGTIRLEKDIQVNGDVTVFGGRLRRDPAARVGGDIGNFGGFGWILLIFVLPLGLFAGFIVFLVWLIRRLFRPALPASA